MCKGLAALPQTCRIRAKEIKSKLGVLLQKPENGIDLIIPYPEKPEKKPEKLQKPFLRRLLSGVSPGPCADTTARIGAMLSVWQENMGLLVLSLFLHLSLHLQGGLAMFRSFLRSEFSEENIEFWVACEDFKKTKSPMKMAVKARKIYEDFIQTEGPREVNIDHYTKDVTLRNLVDLSPVTFDLAQKRIYALMEKDSFGRFLRSEQYQELVK
nr:regulator of G-protein signaling 5 [Salvelinus alpinus]